MAIDGPPSLDGRTPCDEAAEALKFAIIGLFCCGIIFSPMAISKALNARRAIQADPTLIGEGKANVAMMLGIVGLALWVLSLISRAMMKMNN